MVDLSANTKRQLNRSTDEQRDKPCDQGLCNDLTTLVRIAIVWVYLIP